MVLITQSHSIPMDEYQKYNPIILLTRAEESIPAETVKALLEGCSETKVVILSKQADDMELAFSIGTLVGEHGGSGNVSISLESSSVKEMLKRMGMGDALYVPHKRVSGRQKVSGSAQTGTRKKSEKKAADTAAVADMAPYNTEKPASKAGKKLPAAFTKALKSYGVEQESADKVACALRDSTESISYEVRLRLNLMNKDEASDVYAKTKDHYQELKGMIA